MNRQFWGIGRWALLALVILVAAAPLLAPAVSTLPAPLHDVPGISSYALMALVLPLVIVGMVLALVLAVATRTWRFILRRFG